MLAGDEDLTSLQVRRTEHTGSPSANGSVDDVTGLEIKRTEANTGSPIARGSARFELEPGTMVGEYRIERKIARGGMGIVYAAVHPVIAKRAAIKVLREDLTSDRATERFVTEARVVNEIRHPNIVDVFSFGELPNGRRYFAMEWLDGESLRARLNRGRLSIVEACAIVRPLVAALAAAHAHDVIHRDVKPENVMLVPSSVGHPVVKLLDFGIAKLGTRTDELTYGGQLLGTPMYAAPEQAQGLPITPAVDIYSLGALLFEMLVGRPPFQAKTGEEVMGKHITEQPPAPSEFADVPGELDRLVVEMLDKHPKDRPSLVAVDAVVERVAARRSTAPTVDTRAEPVTAPDRPPPSVPAAAPPIVVAAPPVVATAPPVPVTAPPLAPRAASQPPAPAFAVPAVERGWSTTKKVGVVGLVAVSVGIAAAIAIAPLRPAGPAAAATPPAPVATPAPPPPTESSPPAVAAEPAPEPPPPPPPAAPAQPAPVTASTPAPAVAPAPSVDRTAHAHKPKRHADPRPAEPTVTASDPAPADPVEEPHDSHADSPLLLRPDPKNPHGTPR